MKKNVSYIKIYQAIEKENPLIVSCFLKTSHHMQDFTYKSTQKKTTRVLSKVVVNNFKNNKIFKRNKFRFRYLPHDPQMVLENTFNETIDELPVTVEALNLPPIPANDYGSGTYNYFCLIKFFKTGLICPYILP